MNIVLLCATERGLRFAKKLKEICPSDKITLVTFREFAWEKPFLEKIQKFASEAGCSFFESKRLDSEEISNHLSKIRIDLMFVVSWRFMIPSAIYSRARLGCIVFHDSMLPRYRGFAPTNWAIINGERETGVSMFYINEEVDSGPIISQKAVEIGENEFISSLAERVTDTYIELLEQNIEKIKSNNVKVIYQDESKASYTCKRIPEDGRIDWGKKTVEIFNLIRAISHPWTGAYTFFNGKKLYIWSASLLTPPKKIVGRISGRVVSFEKDGKVEIATGDGSILLADVQMEGGESVSAGKILKSMSDTLG